MNKDILVFNKQGGVGIGLPPIEDSLTIPSSGYVYMPVYDNNGNHIGLNLYLRNPYNKGQYFDSFRYKLFEEEVEKVPAGYNTINVPHSNILYVFTNVAEDSVLVDVPLANVANVSTSDGVAYTGTYAVKIDNTSGFDAKIYYKDCEYAEVLL